MLLDGQRLLLCRRCGILACPDDAHLRFSSGGEPFHAGFRGHIAPGQAVLLGRFEVFLLYLNSSFPTTRRAASGRRKLLGVAHAAPLFVELILRLLQMSATPPTSVLYTYLLM